MCLMSLLSTQCVPLLNELLSGPPGHSLLRKLGFGPGPGAAVEFAEHRSHDVLHLFAQVGRVGTGAARGN